MKKLLILLLSAALIAAACSDGETHVPVTGQVDSGDATATEEDAPKAEPTAEPSSESAAEPSEELGSDEIAAEEEQAETSVEQCQTAGNI